MCSTISFTPNGPGGTCTPVPTAPGFNDLYFVVSNSVTPGPCYLKRFLKPEERCVLNDIGYSTITTYTSNAILTTGTGTVVTYSATCPAIMQIVGLNDGLLNGTYIYSTTTNSYNLLAANVLANDSYSSALQISCLEVVYNNAVITPSGVNYIITAPAGTGFVLLKYYPTDGAGNFGNATYIYVYFLPSGCNLTSQCNLIQNGGFESNQSTNNVTCGSWSAAGPLSVSCWEPYYSGNNPFLYGNQCSNSGNFILGVNTLNTNPPVSAINFSPSVNSYCASVRHSISSGNSAAIKNNLSTLLVNGQAYAISFWAINKIGGGTNTALNLAANSMVVSVAALQNFASLPTLNFPNGLTTLASFTLNAGHVWTQLTATFVCNAPGSSNALVIGINQPNTPLVVNSYYELFLDDINIVPLGGPSFAITTQTTCGATGISDLMQYSSITSGTFSGIGISQNGLQYDFNVPPVLPAGTYNISYSYTANGCNGVINSQVTLPLQTNCCSNTTIPTFTAASVSGSTANLIGSLRVANDFTIQSGTHLTITGEIIMSPSVQITVSSGATLTITDAHLYSCGNEMWQGIVLKSGGIIYCLGSGSGYSSLIEDAKTAIDISNYNGTLLTDIMVLNNSIFNKNFIDIKISNYDATFSQAYKFNMSSCVFTCRQLPFNSVSWPSTGSSSAGSNQTAQLRYAASTAGLSAPYFVANNFQICNLKAPHSNHPSQTAILLQSVGATWLSNFKQIDIGDDSNVGNFNLFDAHGEFISAVNSNIGLVNNVFQNTINYVSSEGGLGSNSVFAGGKAVKLTNNQMNTALTITATATNLGCRFWDCHTAIYGENVFRFNLEKAQFRSVQTNTLQVTQRGTNGLTLGTNRFQYYFKDNEFTNIAYPINIPIASGVYTTISTGTQTGIYADKIIVLQNAFASGSTSGQNINTAINITCPNQFPFTMANDYLIVPYTKAIVVEQNTMTAVERGVAINGITGFQTTVERNSITVRSAISSQHGIDLSNCLSANNVLAQQRIITNTIVGASPSASLESLVYNSNNLGGLSPSVTCNYLSNSHQGFVFNMTNSLSVWVANEMQPLNRGLVLTNNGSIGTQGTASVASNNQWQSTWANDQTYVDAASDATNSILYVKPGSNTTPSNNGGPQQNLRFAAGSSLKLSSVSDYLCSNVPFTKVIYPPNEEYFDNSLKYQIIRHSFYRFLLFNDSIRDPGNECDVYFQNLSGASNSALADLENYLYHGDISTALAANDDIILDSEDELGNTCKAFYELYLKHMQLEQDSTYSSTDSTNLEYIAVQCPESAGPCVYQARALINTIYGVVHNYSDCGVSSESRPASTKAEETLFQQKINYHSFTIIPNPAMDQIKIITNSESLHQKVEIRNLLGQVLLSEDLNTKNYISTLGFDLPNGIYLVTIINNDNTKATKKLHVSR